MPSVGAPASLAYILRARLDERSVCLDQWALLVVRRPGSGVARWRYKGRVSRPDDARRPSLGRPARDTLPAQPVPRAEAARHDRWRGAATGRNTTHGECAPPHQICPRTVARRDARSGVRAARDPVHTKCHARRSRREGCQTSVTWDAARPRCPAPLDPPAAPVAPAAPDEQQDDEDDQQNREHAATFLMVAGIYPSAGRRSRRFSPAGPRGPARLFRILVSCWRCRPPQRPAPDVRDPAARHGWSLRYRARAAAERRHIRRRSSVGR
jgi:hypothetical protein